MGRKLENHWNNFGLCRCGDCTKVLDVTFELKHPTEGYKMTEMFGICANCSGLR